MTNPLNEHLRDSYAHSRKLTSFAKLAGIFEYLDIFLEQMLSPIVVVEHQHILDSLQKGLDQRQVTHVDIGKFFTSFLQTRQSLLKELQLYGGMYSGGSKERRKDHLIVGFITYDALSKSNSVVPSSEK